MAAEWRKLKRGDRERAEWRYMKDQLNGNLRENVVCMKINGVETEDENEIKRAIEEYWKGVFYCEVRENVVTNELQENVRYMFTEEMMSITEEDGG